MSRGKVYLVGAGPGDEKLITVRGIECLQQADTVVYDRLANPRLLRFAKPDAEFIFCGKFPKHHVLRQEAINELLVQKAREGKRIIRLKGGDPSVFGRVGEEAAALADANIEYEIVPGITAGIAVPAYAGIPVTHREYGSSFALVTGHAKTEEGIPKADWSSLAGIDTVAFYMGVKNLPYICESLLLHGRDPKTPIALISWGTTGRQRTVQGTLEDIVARIKEAGITNPAITLVGEIVKVREHIQWFEKKPLFGRRILVARTGAEPGNLAAALAEQGADVVEYPYFSAHAVHSAALEETMRRSGQYAQILFTSPESVAFFFEAYQKTGKDIRALSATFYALSARTARRLKERGFTAEIATAPFSADDRWLIVGEESLAADKAQYEAAWGACDIATVYKKKERQEYNLNMVRLLKEEPVDTIVFPSAASVDALVRFLERDGLESTQVLQKALLVCMGEAAADALRSAGCAVDRVAASPSIPDLLACITLQEANC
ncbi:uroporphyrinogen-III C-methyltransferase [Aneurinibacillus sp. BA2021]|nr:uroporphyrinogen-III C-methyltransferase [Aneurinibacillus sp. BA2021]